MCLGSTHATAGAVAGAAVAEYALRLPPSQAVILTGLTAGAAVLPDLDHPNSTLAHCFGFLTKAFAALVGKVSGGHRHGTHSLAGVAVFTAVAWLAVATRHGPAGRVALGAFLSLIIAGGLYALRIGGHFADVLAVGGAVAMTVTGTGLPLVALATGLGCAAHIAADMLTDSGCPLLLPLSRYRFKAWPEPFAFTTGTLPERAIVAPAFALTLAWICAQAVLATLAAH
jgi:membrane-bound metal-dependent hydrolase YbcI (DUF457 family)